MDALGVDRFGIVTQSGGTPYGIAVAGAVPERVTAHSPLGAIAPLAEKAQWRTAGKDMKMAAMLSRRAPFLLRAGFKQQYKKLPDSALGLVKGPDAQVVQIPWVKELFVPTTAELFANPDGFIEETRILCKPWGSRLGRSARRSGLVSLTGCTRRRTPVASPNCSAETRR